MPGPEGTPGEEAEEAAPLDARNRPPIELEPPTVPPAVGMSPERYRATMEAAWFVVGLIIVPILLDVTGFSPWLARTTESYAGAMAPLGYSVVLVGILLLAGFPFRLASTYGADRRAGLAAGGPLRYVARDLPMAALVLAAAVPVLAFLGPILALTDLWWLAFWFIFAAAVVATEYVYPRTILPFLVRTRRLPDAGFGDDVYEVLERSGLMAIERVIVARMAHISRRPVVRMVGVLKHRLILLSDSLVAAATGRELTAAVAEKAALVAVRFDLRRVLLTVGLALPAFILGGLLFAPATLLLPGGEEVHSSTAGVPLAIALVAIPFAVVQPIRNRILRSDVEEADERALTYTHDPEAHIALHERMARMVGEDARDREPSWYHLLLTSDPATGPRVRYARDWAKRHEIVPQGEWRRRVLATARGEVEGQPEEGVWEEE